MLQVKNFMTTELFTLKASDSLHSARKMMSLARIRHIPIIDDAGLFVGLLTHRNLLEATFSKFAEVDKSIQDEIDSGIPISEIMRTDVTTTTGEALVREVARILLDNKYGCLPVLSNGVLIGIITESDFLKLAIRLMDDQKDIS